MLANTETKGEVQVEKLKPTSIMALSQFMKTLSLVRLIQQE
jgi:hypothetical protein